MMPETNKVKILAFDYAIQWMTEDAEFLGMASSDQLVIKLREKQPEAVLRDTLLHEIVHCLNYHLCLKDRPTDEEIASRLSTGLLTFFRDNLELSRWLIG